MSSTPLVIQTKVDLAGFDQFNSAAKGVSSATQQMADKFLAAGISAKDAASALQNMGVSSTEAAAAVGILEQQGQKLAATMDGGVRSTLAKARIEMAAMSGNVGGLEYSFARLAGRIPGVADAISLAFPALAAVALVEVIGEVVEKFQELKDKALDSALAWDKVEHSSITFDDHLNKAIAEADEKIEYFTNHTLTGMDREIKQATVDTDELFNHINSVLGGFEEEQKKFGKGIFMQFLTGEGGTGEVVTAAKTVEEAVDRALNQGDTAGAQKAIGDALKENLEREQELANISGSADRIKAYKQLDELLVRYNDDISKSIELAQKENEANAAEKGYEARKNAAEQLKQLTRAQEEEGNQLIHEYAREQEAQERASKEALKAKLKDDKDYMDMKILEAEKGIEAADKAAAKEAEIAKREAESEMQSAIEAARRKAEIETSSVSAGTGGGALAQKKAILEQEYEAQREAVLKYISLLDGSNAEDVAKAQEASNKIVALHDQMVAKEAQLDSQYREKFERSMEAIVNGPFNSFIDKLIQGKEKVSVVFTQLGASLLENLTKTLADMALKWVEHWALVQIENALGIAQVNALTAAGNATKAAQTSTTNTTIAVSDAGAAAAGAFASVMDALPFPINVAVAPEVAGAALAQGLGYAAVASQEKGGLTLGEGLSYLHPSEITMPEDVSRGFRNIVAAGNSPGAAIGGGGGPIVFAPTIHATDSAGVERLLVKHANIFHAQIKKWARNGSLGR